MEDIYKNFLGVTFLEHYKRAGVDNAKLTKKEWHLEFNREFFEQERKHWMEVDSTNIQEYDLLLFFVRRKRIGHFGVYIAQNTFIHIEEESYCMFQELNEEYRDRLWGVYRYETMV